MSDPSGIRGYNVRLLGLKLNPAPIPGGDPFPYLGAISATDYSSLITITAVDNAGNESDPVTLSDLGKTLVTAPAAPEGTDLPAGTRDAIDAIAATKLKPNTTVDGAIIAVDTADGQYYRAYGGDRTEGLTLTLDHKMRYGSCSKMWTSLLILNRISEGYIGLNDTVDMYVDGIPNGDRITIRMLLQNRSGLKDYLQQDATVQQNYFLNPTGQFDPMPYIRATPPIFEPDTQCSYSNANWILQGVILEWVDAHHLHPEAPRLARTIILEDSCAALGLGSVEWPTGNYMSTPYSRGWAINLALPAVKAAVEAARSSLGFLGVFLPQDPVQLVALLQQLGLGPQFGIPAGLQLTAEIELTAVSTTWSGAAGSLDGPIAEIVKFMKQLPNSELISDEVKQARAETFCTYLTYEPANPWSGPGWMGHGLGVITWGDWWGWIGNLGGYKCTAFVNHLTEAVIVVMMNHMAAEDLDCFYQIAYLLDPASTLTVPDVNVRLDDSIPSGEEFGNPKVVVWQQSGDEFGTVGVPHKVPYVVGVQASNTRNLKPASIPSGEAFGGLTVLKATNDPLQPASITSEEAFGTPSVTVGFVPVTEINTNRTNQQVPVGATEWRVRLTGGGAAGAPGAGGTGTGLLAGGRGGGGGGGLQMPDWQPIALLGPTYSVQRGLGATTPSGNGSASTFTSGGVSLSAGGGTGENGGTCSATGLPTLPTMNTGGKGATPNPATSPSADYVGAASLGCAGAGGGAGGPAQSGNAGRGGNGGSSVTVAGALAANTAGLPGASAADAATGEGGAGGAGGAGSRPTAANPNGGAGGNGGKAGGGGGGSGAYGTPGAPGAGGDGQTVVEFR